MWRQLIWKQWREQQWRIAFATVILCATVAIGVRSRLVSDAMFIDLALLGSAFVLPIFMAMGLVAPDRADRTHATLLSLPTRPVLGFAATMLVGLAATVIPLLAALLVYLTMAGERELAREHVVWAFIMGLYVAVVLLWWTLCLTTRVRSEGMVGLAGIAIVVFWMLWIGLGTTASVAYWSRFPLWPLHPFSPRLLADQSLYPVTPWGQPLETEGLPITSAAMVAVGTQLLVLAALWFVGLRDYRRTEALS